MTQNLICPQCGSDKVSTLSRNRYRCYIGHEWKPPRLPLQLSIAEWQKVIRGFLSGRTSEKIAMSAKLHRQQTLRALKLIRQVIYNDPPMFIKDKKPEDILNIGKRGKNLELFTPHSKKPIFGEKVCYDYKMYNTATLRAIARELNNFYDPEDPKYEIKLKTNIPREKLIKQLEAFSPEEIEMAVEDMPNYYSDWLAFYNDYRHQLYLPRLNPPTKTFFMLVYHGGRSWFLALPDMEERFIKDMNITKQMWYRLFGIVPKTHCLAPPHKRINPKKYKPPKLINQILIRNDYRGTQFYKFWTYIANKWKFDKRGIGIDQVPLYLAQYCWLYNNRNLDKERKVKKLITMLKNPRSP